MCPKLCGVRPQVHLTAGRICQIETVALFFRAIVRTSNPHPTIFHELKLSVCLSHDVQLLWRVGASASVTSMVQ
jgi:hypothetical protein